MALPGPSPDEQVLIIFRDGCDEKESLGQSIASHGFQKGRSPLADTALCFPRTGLVVLSESSTIGSLLPSLGTVVMKLLGLEEETRDWDAEMIDMLFHLASL
jgi:hypothetical protein